MPHVMNALDKPVTVKCFGNYISFTPRQIKYVANENMALKISIDNRDDGLVSFPEEAMEMDKNGPEFKRIIAEKRKEGLNNYIRKLTQVVRNLEISVQKDLDIKNIKGSIATYASDGELAAMRELAQLKSTEENQEALKTEEYEKLREQASKHLKR